MGRAEVKLKETFKKLFTEGCFLLFLISFSSSLASLELLQNHYSFYNGISSHWTMGKEKRCYFFTCLFSNMLEIRFFAHWICLNDRNCVLPFFTCWFSCTLILSNKRGVFAVQIDVITSSKRFIFQCGWISIDNQRNSNIMHFSCD